MSRIAILLLMLCASAQAQFHTLRNPAFLAMMNRTNAPVYTPNATDFDGSNDYITRGADLTGNADGKKGTVSFWIKYGVNSETITPVWSGNAASTTAGIYVYRAAQHRMFVDAYSGAGAKILAMSSVASFTAASGWRHFAASWDLATGSGQIYVDGSASLTGSPTLTDATINYTEANHAMGAFANGTSKMTACVADFYLNLAEQVDLSVNLSKFYINGNPVDLGADGSTPTGTQPIVFLKNAFGTWQNNLGSGGNFTVTGTLTACSDAP